MVRKAPEEPISLPPPATTLEGREDQLIALTINKVEQRISDGTATAQEYVHFLKLGTVREQLEREKLRSENEMLLARVKDAESRKDSAGLYAAALRAFKGYSGQEDIEDEDEDAEFY